MNQEYFDKVTELEKMNASDQYILGWQEGYQDARSRRAKSNRCISSRYEDGKNNNFDNVEKFKDYLDFVTNRKPQEFFNISTESISII